MPKPALIFLLAFGLCSYVLPLTTQAEFISIQTELTSSFDGKRFGLQAKVTNKGDEAAYQVSVSAEVNGVTVSGPARETLDVDDSDSVELTQELALPRPGEYPVIVTVRYEDANQYPFSAISIAPLVYGETRPARISATLNNLQISDSGVLKFNIRNLDEKVKSISTRLVIPKELSASGLSESLTLQAGSEQGVQISVRNVSANPGSSYPIYVLLSYDEDNSHYSTAISGNIGVIIDQGFVRSNQALLIGLSIAFAIGFVYVNIRFLRDGKGQSPSGET